MLSPSLNPPLAARLPGLKARSLALIALARPYPKLWFVALPTLAMALLLQDGSPPTGAVVLTIAAFCLTDAGLTTLNDIQDVRTDALSMELDRRARPLIAGSVSVRLAYVQVVACSFAGVAVGFVISPWFGALLACGTLYSVGYSVRPVYAGGRPFVSQLFWIVLWPAIYLAVHLAVGGDLAAGLPYVASTMLFMGIGETLAKDLRDLDNDAAAGKRTTPVAVGRSRAALACFVAFLVGSAGFVAAAALTEAASAYLTLALAVVLALWVGRAGVLSRQIAAAYSKAPARDLHMGSIRVFITVSLLFIAGICQ